MMRITGAAALALGAVLGFGGVASAGDDTPSKAWSTTMTLGGQGTVAEAATEDVELTAHHGGYHGGFHGGYGGYHGGYRGGYYGGYRGGYGGYRGYYGGYRPYYAGYRGFYGYPRYYGGYGLGWYRPWGFGGYYRRPYYYSSYYYPSYYGGYGYSSYGYGGYGYCGIGGTAEDADAPVVTLNMAVANSPFRPHDTEAKTAPAPADTLPVSLTKPSSPYTYKAYGEK
jgi:hypothetical protein